MILSLQLKHAPATATAPAAWFLPGTSPARWLEELARCGLARLETRLFVIPQSLADRTPVGVLVVPGRTDTISTTPAGVPCKLLGRLFLPVDAILQPPITEAELRQLCVLPVLFFHPVLGLSGFEAESALRVSDLLRRPEEQSANWNCARPGAGALPELLGITLLQPPSIEDIFGNADEDIGSEPFTELPPAPNEPSENPAAKTGRNLRRGLAKSVSQLMRFVPHTASKKTWLNNVEDWANRQLRSVSNQLEQLRNKELHRLLHLLQTDPEAGLRHAIPMNHFAHRGVAPPSARLGSRPPKFNPHQLGGQAADYWNIGPDLQAELRQRYRDMANRELQLGRYQRAAYIFAELLGDLFSAAGALTQGKFFREAALLYGDHLKNPLEAARCLAEGGLVAEAVERYEKLGCWLEIADLYERTGDQAAADVALRRVVADRLALHDILGAAKLVETRLRSPDEALEMLLAAWPASAQAVNCLAAAFELMGRLGRHEAALDQLARRRRDSISQPLVQPLIATLTGIARQYPDRRVQPQAADFSRVLIAGQLQKTGISAEQMGKLLEQLVRLAPQDRLLARDANRYLASRREAERRTPRITRPPPLPGKSPTTVHKFELPRQIEWLHLRHELHWFFALGVTAKRLTLLRGVSAGQFQSLSWECPREAVKNGFVFDVTAEAGRSVALARPDGAPLRPQGFPATDLFFNRECVAGTPSWLPTEGFPFAFGPYLVWSVHQAAGRAIVSCHDKSQGQLQRTIDISDELLNDAERTDDTQFAIAALPSGVAVALGNRLVLPQGDGSCLRVELPGQVIRLAATPANTRAGVAIFMHHGAAMYWTGGNGCIELDRDIARPIGAFVTGGPIVLASGLELMVLNVDSRGVHNVTRLQLKQRAVGVSATTNPNEFAVLDERGEITVYKTPAADGK